MSQLIVSKFFATVALKIIYKETSRLFVKKNK